MAAYSTLYEVLVKFVKSMAPILPFVTEEIYQNLVRAVDDTAPESVHHTAFPALDESLLDTELSEDIQRYLDQEPVSAGPPSAAYRDDELIVAMTGGEFAGPRIQQLLPGLVAGLTDKAEQRIVGRL